MGGIFVSYSRDDGDRGEFRGLLKDLDRLADAVWHDEDLKGGQRWWDEILHQIRSCSLFLTVASRSSLQSEACRLELRYAAALGRPLLCVKIDPIDELDLAPCVSTTEVVDYSGRAASADAGADCLFELQGALTTMNAEPVPDLPDPLPVVPQAPGSYQRGLREVLEADQLSFAEQQDFLDRVGARANDRSADTLADLLELLDAFSARPEIMRKAALEAAELTYRIRRSGHRAAGAPTEPDSAREVATDADRWVDRSPAGDVEQRVTVRRFASIGSRTALTVVRWQGDGTLYAGVEGTVPSCN